MSNINCALAFVVITFTLGGCAITQTPYEVKKSDSYVKNKQISMYHLGVTEEKINDRIYSIVVKLNGASNKRRARDMWFLHAANLTLDNNYKKFAPKSTRGGHWCRSLKNRNSGQKSVEEVANTFRGFVLLANSKSELSDHKRIYDAKITKSKSQVNVDTVLDQNTMSVNNDRLIQNCRDKR